MELNFNRTPILKFVLPFILGIISQEYLPGIYEGHFEFIVFIILYLLFSTICLRRYYTLVGLYWILFFFLTGGIHSRLTQLKFQKTHFSHFSESEMIILRVDETVELKDSTRCLSTVLYLGNDSLEFRRSTGQLMAYLSKESPTLSIGQCILVNYKFFLEKSNTNPHVFDYKEYLNNRGIYHRGHYKDEEVIFLNDLKRDNLSIKARRLREVCLDHFSYLLSNDNNIAVAAAMILGERKLLSDELYDCLLYTSPSPRDATLSRMPSSA